MVIIITEVRKWIENIKISREKAILSKQSIAFYISAF